MIELFTWQDYEAASNKPKWIGNAITRYKRSDVYKDAIDESSYERGQDVTIMNTMRYIYQVTGEKVRDFTSANYMISSNIFHRINTQKTAYLLGNGVSFSNTEQVYINGEFVTIDKTKDLLGYKFDRAMYDALYWALINGESYTYVHRNEKNDGWVYDLFKREEFVPIIDEDTGTMKAGILFWSLDWNTKPINAVLYTEQGYTKYQSDKKRGLASLHEVQPLTPYLQTVHYTEFDGEEIVGGDNYGALPIFPLRLNDKRYSTLKFLRPLIDAQDMILSGLANDLHDCTQVYWTVSNAMGMDDESLTALRDRMRLTHIVAMDEANGATITPYTQEIPFNAQEAALKELHDRIYADMGALDLQTITAGATNDHIEASYKPMDEETDNYEYYMIEFIQDILNVMLNIEDTPVFKRARITNEKELTEMVLLASNFLDEETVLNKLPFLTVDEVQKIMLSKNGEVTNREVDEEWQKEEQEIEQENKPIES